MRLIETLMADPAGEADRDALRLDFDCCCCAIASRTTRSAWPRPAPTRSPMCAAARTAAGWLAAPIGVWTPNRLRGCE